MGIKLSTKKISAGKVKIDSMWVVFGTRVVKFGMVTLRFGKITDHFGVKEVNGNVTLKSLSFKAFLYKH